MNVDINNYDHKNQSKPTIISSIVPFLKKMKNLGMFLLNISAIGIPKILSVIS